MAEGNQFTVSVVTPGQVLLEGSVVDVVLRTAEGDITFLAGHTSLVGSVEPGVVRVTDGEGTEVRIAVHGGFVQVETHAPAGDPGEVPRPGGSSPTGPGPSDGRVTVLAGVAELAGDIDIERARAALAAAESRIHELGSQSARGVGGSGPSGEDGDANLDLVEAEAARTRARVRLEAAGAVTDTGPVAARS